MIDLDRITHPLRLAKGSHQPAEINPDAINSALDKIGV